MVTCILYNLFLKDQKIILKKNNPMHNHGPKKTLTNCKARTKPQQK